MWTADKLVYRGEDDFIKAYQGSELVWYRDRNKIFYTSTDGSIITPYVGTGDEYGFGANIVSNTYSDGKNGRPAKLYKFKNIEDNIMII